ncbi:MAG: SRPBCC family protein [Candidatus Angelobacter sp.]
MPSSLDLDAVGGSYVWFNEKRNEMAAKPIPWCFRSRFPRGLLEAFAFFSRAENLEALTPPWMHFKIRSVESTPVGKGTLITYSLRVHGIPLRWVSEIAEWEPPRQFVDAQLRGPYKLWRRQHRFEASNGGTQITDIVDLGVAFRRPGLSGVQVQGAF